MRYVRRNVLRKSIDKNRKSVRRSSRRCGVAYRICGTCTNVQYGCPCFQFNCVFFSIYLAGIERATEANVHIVVEQSRIVPNGVRVRHWRRIRNGTVHKVVEVNVVDTLVTIALLDDKSRLWYQVKILMRTWLISDIHAVLSCMLGAIRCTTLTGPPLLLSTISWKSRPCSDMPQLLLIAVVWLLVSLISLEWLDSEQTESVGNN